MQDNVAQDDDILEFESIGMTAQVTSEMQAEVWFIFDGGCPLCAFAANAFQIKKAVGSLHLLDARKTKDHPLLREVKARDLDLDQGMVLAYQNEFYHGQDALHMMALLGSDYGWVNKMNAGLFRYKLLARICYPPLRMIRNMLLHIKGMQKLRDL